MNYQIGDWVRGNTNQGELIHGFVESLNLFQETVGIHVVASDHEAAIGRFIEVSSRGVRKLPVNTYDTEEQLRSLIDIALATRDETWFAELTGQLLSLQQASGSGGEQIAVTPALRNRLGSYTVS